ncbi:hypothetical protein [Microbacterium allomyrinae]|uniref:Uncharacterized protein n=1 Tax=Microbacterium allomyrinae TaxID=2830666 RepID=A0A9X1LU15_9MICO|nr:hypothetical protein [Microbacterium allomyrinae]MCC2031802.1 hypothetical protein [Microbacterium allomyrinae]
MIAEAALIVAVVALGVSFAAFFVAIAALARAAAVERARRAHQLPPAAIIGSRSSFEGDR